MRPIRSILDSDILALKGATEASFVLGKGLTSFALMTRVGVSTLSKYASNSDEWRDNVIPIDVAVEADRRAGMPTIIKEAAKQLGYELSPIDGSQPLARKLTDCDVIDFMKEASDVFNALLTARADGHVCCADKQLVEIQLRELERKIAEVRINLAEG